MAVVKLAKNKDTEPTPENVRFDWRDLAVGRRLRYYGSDYDEPTVFEITGVSRARGVSRFLGSEIRDLDGYIEVRCDDDVRTLGIRYVRQTALWALLDE